MISNRAPEIALRIWPILTAVARQRHTITRRELARQVYGVAIVGDELDEALQLIRNWCQNRGLPCLDILVVDEDGDPVIPL